MCIAQTHLCVSHCYTANQNDGSGEAMQKIYFFGAFLALAAGVGGSDLFLDAGAGFAFAFVLGRDC